MPKFMVPNRLPFVTFYLGLIINNLNFILFSVKKKEIETSKIKLRICIKATGPTSWKP